MNKRPLTLIAWLVTTAGAFGLGWALKSSNSVSPKASQSAITPTTLVPSEREAKQRPAGKLRADDVFMEAYLRDGKVSPADMKLAMTALMKENDPLKRAALFAALLDQVTPENAKDAFLSLKESTNGRRGFGRGGGGDEMRMLLNKWGRVDGEGAVKELTALREAREAAGEADNGGRGGRGGRGAPGGDASGDGGGMDFMSAISGWATTDVNAAAKYVNGIEDERQSMMYTAGIIQGLMVNGADDAMKFLSEIPEDNQMRGRYTSMVATEMLEQGVDSAKSWADGITDPQLKGGALSTVAGEYARENLVAAVKWVTDYADEAYASDALNRVANQWAQSDPQAVLEWAGDLPETAQAAIYAEALDEWTERDPAAASEFLAEMPASPAKDNAIHGFATELSREDPASAIAWAETIGDQALRTEALTQVAQSWYRTDQTAAAAWLESSGLPDEAQQAAQAAPRFDFGGRGAGRGRGR